MKILKDNTNGKKYLHWAIRIISILVIILVISIMTVRSDSLTPSVEDSTYDCRNLEPTEEYLSLEEFETEEESETIVDADETFVNSVDERAEKLPVITTGKIYVKKLNVRSSSSSATPDNIIGLVVYDDQVNIVGKENGWYKIEYDNDYGYVYAKYVNSDWYEETDTTEVDNNSSEITTNQPVENITYQLSTNVIGSGYVDHDALYNTIETIAPELTSICDALISNYEQYGLKPSFQLAVFCLESGYGTSYLARNKNNICGLNAYATSTKSVYENASSFETKSDCVLKFGSIIYNSYVLCGLTSIESISTKYCPPNSRNWTNSVCAIQSEIESAYNSYAV